MDKAKYFQATSAKDDRTELIRVLLSAAIFVYALGLWLVVFGQLQTHFGNYLFMVLEHPHARALAIERITVSVFLLLAFINMFSTRWFTVLPLFAYILFESYAGYYQGGYRFSEFTFYAHALRYSLPLVLLALCCFPFVDVLDSTKRLIVSQWILRAAIAVVFVIHGLECLWAYPVFTDLIIGTGRNLFGIRIMEAWAHQIMKVIGAVDLLVAALILLKPWRSFVLWAAFWGTLTAFSRVTAIGIAGYTEVLLRASHLAGPVALWIILYRPVSVLSGWKVLRENFTSLIKKTDQISGSEPLNQ